MCTNECTKQKEEKKNDVCSFISKYKKHIQGQLQPSTNFIPRRFTCGSTPVEELSKHHAILVQGEAGIGKTQYVECMKEAWCRSEFIYRLKGLYSKGKRFIFITCRELNQKVKRTASNHMKDIMKINTVREFDVNQHQPKLTFIIDGIDELAFEEQCFKKEFRDDLKSRIEQNEPITSSHLILSLLCGFLFPRSKFMLFGRIQEINRLSIIKFLDSNVFNKDLRHIMELSPFSDEEVKILTCMTICQDELSNDGSHACNKIYEKIENVSFKNIPSYASCLIRSFNGYPNKDIGEITKTKLFISTLFTQLYKHTTLGREKEFSTFNRLMRDKNGEEFRICFNCLAELSYRSLINSEVTIRTSQENDDGVNINFNGVLVNRKVCEQVDLFYIRDDGCDVIIEPHHLTFLEFLSSCYLIKYPAIWKDLLKLPLDRLVIMIPFMCGILSDDKFTQDFLKNVLRYQSDNKFIDWLFGLKTYEMCRLPGGYSNHCFGLDECENTLPPLETLAAIRIENKLVWEHSVKTIVVCSFSTFDWYYMKRLFALLNVDDSNEQNIESFLLHNKDDINVEVRDHWVRITSNKEVVLFQKLVQLQRVKLRVDILDIWKDVHNRACFSFIAIAQELRITGGWGLFTDFLEHLRSHSNISKLNRLVIHDIYKLHIASLKVLLDVAVQHQLCIELFGNMFTDDQLMELQSLLQHNVHYRDIRIELRDIPSHQLKQLACQTLTIFTHLSFHCTNIKDHIHDYSSPPSVTHQPPLINDFQLHNYKIIKEHPFININNTTHTHLHLMCDCDKISTESVVRLISQSTVVQVERLAFCPEKHWKELSQFLKCKSECEIRELRIWNYSKFPWIYVIELCANIVLTQIIFRDDEREDLIRLLDLLFTNNASKNFSVRVFNIKCDAYNFYNYEENNIFVMDIKEMHYFNKHKQYIQNYERVNFKVKGYLELLWCCEVKLLS